MMKLIKLGTEENFFLIKDINQKPIANIIFRWSKNECFPQNSGEKANMPALITLIQHRAGTSS